PPGNGRHDRLVEPARRRARGLAEDARVGGRLRHADRDLRVPGGPRRGHEHGADAAGSGSPDREQAGVPHRRPEGRRHRDALLSAEAREVVRQADHRGRRRPGADRGRPRLPQRRAARRQLRPGGVPQPRRLGPAGDSRGLLLRDGRPPEQQLRQPALGIRAQEIHHRQGAAAVVADGSRTSLLSAAPARHQAVTRVLLLVLGFNLAVAAAKLALGYATGAITIISDGYHSLTDSTSNVIGIIGLRVARKPPDADHPYGHRKFETLAAAGIFVFLLLAVLEIGRSALNRLANPSPPIPTALSFVVILGTLAIHI